VSARAAPLSRARRFQQRYAPFLALAIGCAARVWSHHGVDFAPKAVALLALAWMLPFALARWTARGGRQRKGKGKSGRPTLVQRMAELGSTTLVIALFRNVLFFLVPIWFGSATLTSINLAFPLLLAGMALYSCFDRSYRAQVLERPAMRTVWGFVILFAALVPAVAVVASLPPRPAVVISAAIAFLVSSAALLPRERWSRRQSQGHIVLATLAGAFLLTWVAPALPPVPIVCHDAAFGTSVRDRTLEGTASRVGAPPPRLYAWFAVSLPAVYRQGINFQWFFNGRAAGRPVPSSVVGGRKEGYRTWSYLTAPPAGEWRVDVLSDAGQLICRESMAIGAAR
jgi:hypothetical protein